MDWYDDYALKAINKHWLDIEAEFQEVLDDNYRLAKQLLEFELDDEIQKREKIITEQRKLDILGINKKGLEKYLNFKQKHFEKCHNNGHYIFDVTGTAFGNCISVICPLCNEDIDISNIE